MFRYRESTRPEIVLRDAVWADWDPSGRLLVATGSGHLEVREAGRPDLPLVLDHDLSTAEPAPAPPWATRW